MIISNSYEEVARTFEKHFTQYAGNLMDRAYPAMLAHDGLSHEEKTNVARKIILNWLAAVESTQDPELIEAALTKLETLPYPDKKQKQELVELLVRDGFTMLGERT